MSSTPWGCWGNFGVPPGSPPGASSAPQCRCCHPRGCPRGPRGATPGWGCAGGSWPWGRPRGRGRRCCSRGEETRPSSMWLQHRHGATRRLLAFDSAAAHRTEAVPGVLLFLGGHGSPPSASQSSQPSRGTREVSLQLPPLSVSDDGAFVCSVSALHGQVQQVLQLHVIAPPRVSLLPSRLSPGVLAELRCDAVGFFPLDVEIRWERRTHGHTWPYLGDTSGDTPGTTLGPSWSSGHRRAADGTFSRSAGLRVAAVAPGDSYSCLVTHVAWNVPHRVTVVVAGEGHLGTHLGTSGTRCHRAQRGGHGGDGPGGLRHRGAQPEPVALGGEVTPVSPMSPVSPFISVSPCPRCPQVPSVPRYPQCPQ
ncbi:tapasin isoform X4 [Taeniopygia guttata]|uniref:tapasin isoform X4 n=1 Tax=Taeniopygia guttata TaxID=59729 RepID=UPI0011AF5ED6|nr:tapasin isoform X4 [Taeniopygia guttata]